MTDERMALFDLTEKQADRDLVREMLAYAAARIMEVEVELRTGVAKGTRSPLREVQCIGCRERDRGVLVGTAASGKEFRALTRAFIGQDNVDQM